MSVKVEAGALKTALLIMVAGIGSPALAVGGWISADYNSAFFNGDPTMSFGGRIQSEFAKGLTGSITQALNRNLVVDDSKKEWEWNDTTLGLSQLYEVRSDLKAGWRFSVSLPVSPDSRAADLITRPEVGGSVVWDLPYNFTSTTGAAIDVYWHKYSSTKPDGQDDGGYALQQFAYSLSESVSYKFSDHFVLGLNGSYRYVHYHDIADSEIAKGTENRIDDSLYSLGARAGYDFSEGTSLALGFDQGSTLERAGYNDFVVFDKDQSSWSLSLMHSF